MNKKQLPNLITGLRFVLVPPIIWLMLQDEFAWALGLFFVAGFSDALDGFLARRYGGTTLGAFLDPLADKTLMISTYIVLALGGHLPWWLTGLVVLRDAVIISGAGLYHKITGQLEMAPTIASKLNTTAQIGLVLVVMFHLGVMSLWPLFIQFLIAVVTLTTLWSGAVYVIVWGHMAAEERRRSAQ